ncbi:MAG: ribonuclease E/G [Clostridiales bacterium]|nr:ribonuclease E/G [Clostridiales bacterium]
MTVIDVNTGRFTGETDLESTVFETNMAAAREIARVVRLRNIGGLIAVDFIDMAEEEHREAVNAELTRALTEDGTKSRVFPMNDLCVTLFTRKRTEHDLLSFLLKPCPHCTRQGYVLSDKYMAMRIREQILNCFAEGYGAAIVELNRGLMETILSERYLEEDMRKGFLGKRVYMIPHTSWHEEKFTVRGDNSRVLSLPDKAQILY